MQNKETEESALAEFEDALAAALGLVVPPHDPAPAGHQVEPWVEGERPPG